MSLESSIFDALKALTANRVYPDVAPVGATKPYIVWQQVGGQAENFLEAAPVGLRNARIQVACWATTRQAASDLARSAEDALMSSVDAIALGAFSAVYEEDTLLYGATQDFSAWY